MHTFLFGQSDSSQVEQQTSSQALQRAEKQGFIIVESNFKVYAYTSSPLYQAILKLFMEEHYRFQNLIVGSLTRNSLKEAFKKGITAA